MPLRPAIYVILALACLVDRHVAAQLDALVTTVRQTRAQLFGAVS